MRLKIENPHSGHAGHALLDIFEAFILRTHVTFGRLLQPVDVLAVRLYLRVDLPFVCSDCSE